MADPASLTVALTLTGLDITEAQQVLTSLAAGRSMTITATQPVVGGRRFADTVFHVHKITKLCPAQYERPEGRNPGDRIVECGLPAGHPGKHQDAGAEVRWAGEADRTAQVVADMAAVAIDDWRRECDRLKTENAELRRRYAAIESECDIAARQHDWLIQRVGEQRDAWWLAHPQQLLELVHESTYHDPADTPAARPGSSRAQTGPETAPAPRLAGESGPVVPESTPDSPEGAEGPVDVDQLPPIQYLILEVLAARWRTGEHTWPFPAKLTAEIRSLTDLGLVDWKSNSTPGWRLVWLTDAGQAAMLSAGYTPPADPAPGVGEDTTQAQGAPQAVWWCPTESRTLTTAEVRLATWDSPHGDETCLGCGGSVDLTVDPRPTEDEPDGAPAEVHAAAAEAYDRANHPHSSIGPLGAAVDAVWALAEQDQRPLIGKLVRRVESLRTERDELRRQVRNARAERDDASGRWDRLSAVGQTRAGLIEILGGPHKVEPGLPLDELARTVARQVADDLGRIIDLEAGRNMLLAHLESMVDDHANCICTLAAELRSRVAAERASDREDQEGP